ncbi:hypothetical protein GBAR_LOCUS19505 [Geodia barretti]|uniref:Uncharacterized protein n=1 Tax=Geodia barretti TaxID=519541 RepID=A0AA35WZS8_GEOBA|nr:hypothetical protein GBAR_LOCUS19505 [Geodia barretti]
MGESIHALRCDFLCLQGTQIKHILSSDLNRLTGLSVLTRLILSPPVTHETSLAHMTGDLPGNVSLTASLTDSLLRYPYSAAGTDG